MKRSCKVCGKEFNAKLSDVNRGWARCCSKSCAAKLKEKKTGKYARYLRLVRAEEKMSKGEGEFTNAHLFSN